MFVCSEGLGEGENVGWLGREIWVGLPKTERPITAQPLLRRSYNQLAPSTTMATLVIPGQPLTTPKTSATLQAGPGTYSRGGTIYAALRGKVVNEGGVSTPDRFLTLL